MGQVIAGSHKVSVPTPELLLMAHREADRPDGANLVRSVPMEVGDIVFFYEVSPQGSGSCET